MILQSLLWHCWFGKGNLACKKLLLQKPLGYCHGIYCKRQAYSSKYSMAWTVLSCPSRMLRIKMTEDWESRGQLSNAGLSGKWPLKWCMCGDNNDKDNNSDNTYTQDVPPRSTLTNSRRELTSRRYFSRNDVTSHKSGLLPAVSLVSRIRLLTYKVYTL